jgi:Rieske Fe-S protein
MRQLSTSMSVFFPGLLKSMSRMEFLTFPRAVRRGTIGLMASAKTVRFPIGSMRTGHSLTVATVKMDIIFHLSTEWERFQNRIGRLSLEDISDIYASNRTREAYGSREGTITLVIPNK